LRFLLFVSGLCAALASVARAQTPAAAPPQPDLAAMQYFIGKWACAGTNSRHPGVVSPSTFEAAKDDSGPWVVGHLTVYAPSGDAVYRSYDHYTFDPAAKQWVDVGVDSAGGYAVSTSPGPTGNVWVWHDLGLQKDPSIVSQSDTTLTVNDAASYTLAWTYTPKDGTTYHQEVTCKKKA
jgi:hypothetical protein